MLAALEDHLVQNPFTAIGHVKPGRFRRWTLVVILFYLDYATRHFFNRGDLSGVKTIHFARWVFIDGKRRMFFASNYDGSLESYMDDFIDKVAWGLNLVFSNGVGYPRTSWLVRGGARDELAFKDYLRVAPGADARLVLGLRPADRAQHPAERAHPRRAPRAATRRSGCSRCDARPRRHPGALRPRVRRPQGGRVPAARDRGRRPPPGAGSARRPARSRAPRRGPTSARSTSPSRAPASRGSGLPAAALAMFSNEFVAGMTTPHRSRILGDLDENAPERVGVGQPERPADRPRPPALRARRRRPAAARGGADARRSRPAGSRCAPARHVGSRRLRAVRLPRRDLAAVRRGPRRRRARPRRPSAPASSSSATRTSTASTPAARCSTPPPTPARMLPRDAEGSGRADLGRNGSYLVVRQLRQDVPGFWRYVDGATRRPDGTQRPAGAAPARLEDGRALAERRAAHARARRRRSEPRRRERLRLPRARPRGAPAARSARTSAARIRATRSTRGRERATPGRSTAATASCAAAASTARR